jgi:hypothetical protein
VADTPQPELSLVALFSFTETYKGDKTGREAQRELVKQMYDRIKDLDNVTLVDVQPVVLSHQPQPKVIPTDAAGNPLNVWGVPVVPVQKEEGK